MDSNKKEQNKEEYLTSENLGPKTLKWQEDLKLSAQKGNRFKYKSIDSVLLIVDMQGFFLDEKSHAFIPSSKAILPNVENLIKAYREAHLPFVYTRHAYLENEDPGIMARWWEDIILNEDPQSEIVPEILPHENDIVLRKTRYSAFIGTELEDILTIKMARSIVICGLMTHLCCETTAREAFMKDYEVYFVMDATATQTEDLHLSSLRTLAGGFAQITTTSDIISEITGTNRE
jgi:isochorismate hydrolase